MLVIMAGFTCHKDAIKTEMYGVDCEPRLRLVSRGLGSAQSQLVRLRQQQRLLNQQLRHHALPFVLQNMAMKHAQAFVMLHGFDANGFVGAQIDGVV